MKKGTVKRVAVGLAAILGSLVGAYYLLDRLTYKVGKVEVLNAPTFPPLPTKYWDQSLATERTETSEHSELTAAFAATTPGQFTSVVDQKTTIAYRKFLVPESQEKGAVVISSGRTESMLIYRELIGDLNTRGYSVYMHDHAGQGLSARLLPDPKNSQKGYVDNFQRYVQDLKTFVHTVVMPDVRTRGSKPLFLLAHSMGGGVATLYIEDDCCRKDFTAAVLVTPMHGPRMPGWAVPGAKILRFIHPTGYALGQGGYWTAPFVDVKSDLTHSGIRLQRIRQIYSEAKVQAANNAEHDPRLGGPTHAWLYAASEAGKAAVANADKVSIPVLVLQASDDTAVDNAAQGEFCRHVPQRKCEGFLLEKSFHAVFNETDTFRVPALTKIFEFLAQHRAS